MSKRVYRTIGEPVIASYHVWPVSSRTYPGISVGVAKLWPLTLQAIWGGHNHVVVLGKTRRH